MTPGTSHERGYAGFAWLSVASSGLSTEYQNGSYVWVQLAFPLHGLTDISVPAFWLQWTIRISQTLNHKVWRGHRCPVLLGHQLGLELLSPVVFLCSAFEELPNSSGGPQLLISLPTLVIFCFSGSCHPNRRLTVVWFAFPWWSGVWSVFSRAHWPFVYPLEEISVQVFALFWIRFLSLGFRSFLCVLATNPLSDRWICKCFLQSCGFSFCWEYLLMHKGLCSFLEIRLVHFSLGCRGLWYPKKGLCQTPCHGARSFMILS
jgi:hypothetical protein